MRYQRSVEHYPETYRQEQVQQLARWIQAGENGSVVGLAGCGRSNLLHFLGYHPNALTQHLPPQAGPVALIPIDLNSLPAHNPATLYLVILRAFYWVRHRLPPEIQEFVIRLFDTYRTTENAFVAQTALHELLFAFREQETQVVLILNHFDRLYEDATPHMLDSLKGLRDSFKEILSYIVGMVQEAAYLANPAALRTMDSLVDRHVCWVGAMNEADSRFLIQQGTQAASISLTEPEIKMILDLTGCFPTLLRATGFWLLDRVEKPPVEAWFDHLTGRKIFERRLEQMWRGLSQEEQFALATIQRWRAKVEQGKSKPDHLDSELKRIDAKHKDVLQRLVLKGVCDRDERGWRLHGLLWTEYIGRVGSISRGRLWLDSRSNDLYQGDNLLTDLRPFERRLLQFFVENPYREHTYDHLIQHVWEEEFEIVDGQVFIPRDKDHLFQLIRQVRRKIEAEGETQYIINWKTPEEGGYKCYPEGRPE